MTLQWQLNEANKHTFNDCNEADVIQMHYQYAVIKEICIILAAAGNNIKLMSKFDLKGRHANLILSYWFIKKLPIPILKQKFDVLIWWSKNVQNENALKELKFYLEKLIIVNLNTNQITTNETLDHLLLPSQYCWDCNILLEVKTMSKPIFYCRQCGSYVGLHQDSMKPKGYIANENLREWRIKAHSSLDNLWKQKMLQNPDLTKGVARRLAYKWLSNELNIHYKLCHIAFFDEYLCQKVCVICSPYMKYISYRR